MYQIDLFDLKAKAKKYWAHFVLIIMCFFMFNQCNRSDSLAYEKEVMEKEMKEYKKSVAEKLKENKAIKKEVVKLKNDVAELRKENSNSEAKIAAAESKNRKQQSQISKMSEDDMTRYFKKRYDTKTDVVKTNLGIALKDTISKQVITELEDYDFTAEKVSYLEVMYSKEKKANEINAEIIKKSEETEKNLIFVLEKDKDVIDMQNKYAEDQEKEINRQARQNTLLKVSVPVGIAIGVVTGFLITK